MREKTTALPASLLAGLLSLLADDFLFLSLKILLGDDTLVEEGFQGGQAFNFACWCIYHTGCSSSHYNSLLGGHGGNEKQNKANTCKEHTNIIHTRGDLHNVTRNEIWNKSFNYDCGFEIT